MLAQAQFAVARDPEVDGLCGRAANQGVERIGVRACDLGAREDRVSLLQIDDFIARSHEGDARPAMYERCVVRDRRQHTELRRAERGAGWEHDRAFADVLAAAPDVLLRIACIADCDSTIGWLRG